MIPLRDDNPKLGPALATILIIGVNVAVWIFVQGLGTDPRLVESVCTLGAIPGELLGHVRAGTAVLLSPGHACVTEAKPNWFTPLTSMFLHGSWFHIIGNMWFLWVFGDNVEDAMGPLRFIVFYVLCGLAAVTAQVLITPTSAVPMVGASGAIGGVMGAYALLYPRVPVHLLVFLGFYVDRIAVPAFLMLGYWFVLQLLGGIPSLGGGGGGVAFFAHVGGFLTGIALVPLFRQRDRVAAHRAMLMRQAERTY
ncbi:MAG TPA: rhomboid family intramembrane serine protease [Myxococcota bacterium]|nr:rhomboid family intramembrane serine protease [Myxococcota bacterium]